MSKFSFNCVIQTGRPVVSGCFSLYSIHSNTNIPRLGMIIPKRHCRLAVQRNWIKRRIREALRANQAKFLGMNVVVMLKSSTDSCTDQELSQCIKSLFS